MKAKSYQDRPSLSLWLGFALISLLMAIFLGVADLPFTDILNVLAGHGSRQAQSIIWDIRLPRIITGALAGIHLALSGLILQNITRNPLADPSIMGISQGATFAVSLFLILSVYHNYSGSKALPALPLEYLPFAGICGGMFAAVIIYILAIRLQLTPLRITLCGIAVGAVLHALAVGMIAGWGSNRLEVLLDWLTGSLYARSWEHVYYLLPYTIFGLTSLLLMRRPMELLKFDRPIAASFGLSYRLHFSLALFLASLLAASAVGIVGPVTFVGLVVPHFARFTAKNNDKAVLPLTIIYGIICVTLSDLAGRLLGQPDEIPIGVMTAICGAPLLIYFIRKIP